MNPMDVLLIRPPRRGAVAFLGAMECEPLELEYLAAACTGAGLTWALWDGVTQTRPLRAALEEAQPRWAAVTGYMTQEPETRRCLELVKQVCPRCVTVVGGVHAQRNFRRLYWPQTDLVFRGEDVGALAALMAGGARETVPGLCWRAGKGWQENPYAPGDIGKLPLPDRSLWGTERDRFRYMELAGLSTLRTSFSCPYDCAFCYGSGLHGGAYQAMEVEQVLRELENAPGENIFITDYDFLVDPHHVAAILDGVEARGIRKTFVCYARADFIAAHRDLMARLVKNGFTWYDVGIEAVADRRLSGWNKGTSTAVNDACLAVLREVGAHCVALTIADLDFRGEDFHALYAWAKKSGLRYVSVQVLTPIPGTALYEARREELSTGDMRRYDLAHPVLPPEHMSAGAFLRRYRLLWLRLILLAWRRGGYRFVTPAYLLGRCRDGWKRRKLLR